MDSNFMDLDRGHFVLDETSFNRFAALLDATSNDPAGLKRLLALAPPWTVLSGPSNPRGE